MALDPSDSLALPFTPGFRYNNIMADNEIATRAPESDAQEKPAEQTTEQKQETEQAEQSVFPGDTRAQEGPTMGVRCACWPIDSTG
jgi:hypothetical protein